MEQVRLKDGTRIAYEQSGSRSKPAVLLLDGISCDGFVWRYLTPFLKRRFHVIHVQYRGHGLSGIPRDETAVTLPHLAADIEELASYLGVGPLFCIGHSMGVQVALELALRFPSRVRALGLLCGSSGRVLDTFNETDIGMRLLPHIQAFTDKHRDRVAKTLRLLMPTEAAYIVAQNTELNKALVRREDFMPYLEHFATMPPRLFLAMLQDAAERQSMSFLGRIDCPTLVIAGARDGYTPARISRAMAESIPRAQFELLSEGSHTAPIELPEEFERLIARFCDDHQLSKKVGVRARPERPTLGRRLRREA